MAGNPVKAKLAMDPNKPRIQSLARASAIIDIVAAGGPEGVALGDICKPTGLNKTTAFNIASSLISLGFLDRDPASRRYRLGLRNIELGRLAQRRMHVPQIARPILTELCKTTNETVSLAVPDHTDMLVIDSLSGSKTIQATSYLGSRALYHCTALGKAALSHRSAQMRQTIYRLAGLPGLTPHTITDADELERRLPEIRACGYALDREENEIGVNCIGTAVLDGFGDVAAAISVTGPSTRWSAGSIADYAEVVTGSAAKIAQSLCGRGRPGE